MSLNVVLTMILVFSFGSASYAISNDTSFQCGGTTGCKGDARETYTIRSEPSTQRTPSDGGDENNVNRNPQANTAPDVQPKTNQTQ